MRCLIVEDDPDLSEILMLYMQNAGYEVIVAFTVAEGMSQLLRHRFDLVLLDYLLSDGTSLPLSDQAAYSSPNCRVILITGANVYLHGEHVLLAPCIDWIIRKPVDFSQLSALANYAVTEQACA